MKKFSDWISALFLTAGLLFLNACYRQNSLANSVTFEGEVFQGVINDSGVVVYQGPCIGTKVFCENYEGYALTDASGHYVLKITPALRRFAGPDYDTYVIWAEDGTGGDEKIEVKAKPGQTIHVKPFLIYTHTYQK